MAEPKKKKSLAEKIISKLPKGRSSRSRSSKARASLKSFASKIRGKFQSPVHSNGFKQDVLIDMYGGDKGFESGYLNPAASIRARQAMEAGKTFFKHGGTIYRAAGVSSRGRTTYTATADTRAGKVK